MKRFVKSALVAWPATQEPVCGDVNHFYARETERAHTPHTQRTHSVIRLHANRDGGEGLHYTCEVAWNHALSRTDLPASRRPTLHEEPLCMPPVKLD